MASGYSDLSEIRKDNGAYGQYHKPPKINLLNEQPRRESVVERQLACNLARTDMVQPMQQVQQQVNFDLGSGHGYGSQSHTRDDLLGPLDQAIRDYTSTDVGFNDTGTRRVIRSVTASTTTTNRMRQQLDRTPAQELANDLAQKEAMTRRQIAYMNQHQMNPWARPPQVRQPRQEPQTRAVKGQQRWVKECPNSPSVSRPTSRASSTRSNTEAELLEKTAKLLQDAEEMEHKPLKTQEILIENGVRSEETSNSPAGGVSSIHTAVIKVPNTEIDNKSPLPFAYDNLSTLGVRGNIASVGAAPPESPYPPIFPVVKRTLSPTNRMY